MNFTIYVTNRELVFVIRTEEAYCFTSRGEVTRYRFLNIDYYNGFKGDTQIWEKELRI